MSTIERSSEVTEWLVAAGRELGLENATTSPQGFEAADALADAVGRNVDPAAAAASVFLLGMAAGRALDPAVAAHDFVEKLDALARSWNAATDRYAQPNDQARRG